MSEFFRFPHTPHVAWLGHGLPRDDKVMSALEAEAFLAHPVVVEEKVDGANLGFSVDASGNHVLINEQGNPKALAAYQSVGGSTNQSVPNATGIEASRKDLKL